MTGILRADALRLPLRDESVHLIVTSPPYYALRSYRDGGDHYDGQLGSEATPQAFLEALWAVTAECWRVLKPSGSMFVNLGDKRSGSGGHNNGGLAKPDKKRPGQWEADGVMAVTNAHRAARRNAPDRYNQAAFGRPKSKMLLPHRYAIGCEDGLADPDGVGWIVRQDGVWQKLNGLPESVTDRTRDNHEYIFHLTKSERYFSAVDEVREPSEMRSGSNGAAHDMHTAEGSYKWNPSANSYNPLGKLPGSVWPIASEPLTIPDWLSVDHFAAFPQEIPRRLILGWSPSGICTACGEGRRPVVAKELVGVWHDKAPQNTHYEDQYNAHLNGRKADGDPMMSTFGSTKATITGYACACTPYRDHPGTPREEPRNSGTEWAAATGDRDIPSGGYGNAPRTGPWREYLTAGWTPPPTRPSVVLDPFGGTGTTAMVARALGRVGVNVDLSADYCRLARWRVFESGHASKTRERTNREAQGALLL